MKVSENIYTFKTAASKRVPGPSKPLISQGQDVFIKFGQHPSTNNKTGDKTSFLKGPALKLLGGGVLLASGIAIKVLGLATVIGAPVLLPIGLGAAAAGACLMGWGGYQAWIKDEKISEDPVTTTTKLTDATSKEKSVEAEVLSNDNKEIASEDVSSNSTASKDENGYNTGVEQNLEGFDYDYWNNCPIRPLNKTISGEYCNAKVFENLAEFNEALGQEKDNKNFAGVTLKNVTLRNIDFPDYSDFRNLTLPDQHTRENHVWLINCNLANANFEGYIDQGNNALSVSVKEKTNLKGSNFNRSWLPCCTDHANAYLDSELAPCKPRENQNN